MISIEKLVNCNLKFIIEHVRNTSYVSFVASQLKA